MKRRFISLLLVLCLVLSLVAMTACGKKDKDDKKGGSKIDASVGRDDFIADIGGVSDTYTGEISEESYETKDDAVAACINEEIVGTSKTATIESTVSKGMLSDAQITALNLPEELSADVESVEQIEVTYSEAEMYSSLAAASSNTKKVTVYIIKIGPDFKYFTPCPVKGDTITKSYYESVFNDEKYANCTYVNSSYVKIEQTGMNLEMTLTQTIKRDGNKIYLKQVIDAEGDSQYISLLVGSTNRYMEVYIEKDDEGSYDTWVKMSADGEWTESYSSFQVDPFAGQDMLDYTYFSKADFGFALKGENALRFYREYASGNIPDDAKLDLYAEYYVKDGVLSGMRMEYSADITQETYGQTIRAITTGLNKMSCTNYGTTVVEKPVIG